MSLLSLSPIKAPGVEGSETMSKQISWKSSSTIVIPCCSLTEPMPREEMPILTPASTSERRIWPEGVSKTLHFPMTEGPSIQISITIWETFAKLIIDESGWSNSPSARLSLTISAYFFTSRSIISAGYFRILPFTVSPSWSLPVMNMALFSRTAVFSASVNKSWQTPPSHSS